MKRIALALVFAASSPALANPASPATLAYGKTPLVLALGNNSNTCAPEGYRCGNGGDESCCGDLTCQKPDGEDHYICLP